MKQLAALFALLVAVIVFAAWITKGDNSKNLFGKLQSSNSTTSTPGSAQVTVKLGNHEFKAEVAKDESARKKGLSGRNALPEGTGMLFIFDKKDVTTSFWMRDMTFPLDIVWINDDRIVQINSEVPPPTSGTRDDKLQLYSPGQPIDYVFEIKAAESAKNGIKVGDSVEIRGI